MFLRFIENYTHFSEKFSCKPGPNMSNSLHPSLSPLGRAQNQSQDSIEVFQNKRRPYMRNPRNISSSPRAATNLNHRNSQTASAFRLLDAGGLLESPEMAHLQKALQQYRRSRRISEGACRYLRKLPGILQAPLPCDAFAVSPPNWLYRKTHMNFP